MVLFFTIVLAEPFPKQINIFGVQILASEQTPENKVIHAGKILAQYLDNDEDGVVDNQAVVDQLISVGATLIMHNTENEAESSNYDFPNHEHFQDLFGFETHPDFNANSTNDAFDASLEEVLHLITHEGYAIVYPNIFGEAHGSEIANAMDDARGGYFVEIPSQYPEGAWYSYYDETCTYDCMITEYTYWALTSILGAQAYEGRLDEIGDEWTLNTPTLVQAQDTAVYAILTNSNYNLPTVLPDNEYNGFEIMLSIDEGSIPETFALHQSYPNPFNPVTNIRYDISERVQVRMEIHNIMGQRIKTLVNKEMDPGYHSVRWNGTNDMGKMLSTGMYIYTISAGEFHSVRKLVFIK